MAKFTKCFHAIDLSSLFLSSYHRLEHQLNGLESLLEKLIRQKHNHLGGQGLSKDFMEIIFNFIMSI